MFEDRWTAGQKLVARLTGFEHEKTLLVVGLPRGGVPVARAVATALKAELDVCLVRKLGAPGQPELALGAVAEGGIYFLDLNLVAQCGVQASDLKAMAASAEAEIRRRDRLYRGLRFPA